MRNWWKAIIIANIYLEAPVNALYLAGKCVCNLNNYS